jgi:transcriptional regulator with XRE-family HTH domain
MKKSQHEIHAEQFADYVIEALKRTGIKQAELARRSHVSPQMISKLVRKTPHSLTGKLVLPERETVDRIAKAFGDPPSKARQAAGYSADGQVETIEEALETASYFEHKGLSESDREELRPVLKIADREVERILSRLGHTERQKPSNPKVIQSKPRKRDKIDEAIDNALTKGGKPVSDANRKIVREALEKLMQEKSQTDE